MRAYKCQNCGRLIVWGAINKYEEHFCDKECYLKYCEKNKYEPHIEELSYIKGIFL